jgi:hypothetical protein
MYFGVVLPAKQGSHIGRSTLASRPKRSSLANLAILSFPMCPSQACHVDELIVILQSITKVDEVEDSNKSILNKLSQIDPCRKMTSPNKISRPFQLK